MGRLAAPCSCLGPRERPPEGTYVWHYLLAITMAFHEREQTEENPRGLTQMWPVGQAEAVRQRRLLLLTIPTKQMEGGVTQRKGRNTQGQAYQE